MDEDERESLNEALSSARPYLTFPSDIEEKIDDISKDSSDLGEFESEFQRLISREEDPSRRADYRIFLNELRRR